MDFYQHPEFLLLGHQSNDSHHGFALFLRFVCLCDELTSSSKFHRCKQTDQSLILTPRCHFSFAMFPIEQSQIVLLTTSASLLPPQGQKSLDFSRCLFAFATLDLNPLDIVKHLLDSGQLDVIDLISTVCVGIYWA